MEVGELPVPMCSLGNFLSGMETVLFGRGVPLFPGPLETSLVEWKPDDEIFRLFFHAGLGNFLSGMETTIRGGRRLIAASLETSLVEWKHVKLSDGEGTVRTLETSLVEWKLRSRRRRRS